MVALGTYAILHWGDTLYVLRRGFPPVGVMFIPRGRVTPHGSPRLAYATQDDCKYIRNCSLINEPILTSHTTIIRGHRMKSSSYNLPCTSHWMRWGELNALPCIIVLFFSYCAVVSLLTGGRRVSSSHGYRWIANANGTSSTGNTGGIAMINSIPFLETVIPPL